MARVEGQESATRPHMPQTEVSSQTVCRKKLFHLAAPSVIVILTFILLSALVAADSPADIVRPLEAVCDVPSVTHPFIQAAVDDPTCETINLAAGTFNEAVIISRTVTIQGQGAGLTFEEGSVGPVFLIEAGGVVTLTSMTMRNVSLEDDSVILNSGTLTVKESSVSDNFAVIGGGILNLGTLYVTNSTLSDNSATLGGGIGNTGMLTVTNSTLSNNSASAGSGIYNDGGTVYVINSTLSGNSDNGGGISNEGGIVYVTNSIVAQNSPSDCSGAITSLGHNLDSDGSCGLDLSLSDLPNTDPILGPLQDNGGPTLTQALLEGSPAIDAGSEDCPPTDQRGVPRPQDGDGDGIARCDMGAFERSPLDAVCDVPSVTHPLIQAAVDDPTCETINLAAGTFNEDVTISRTVTIQGQGAGLTFEEGSGGPVFLIEAGGVVTLTSMTIRNVSNLYDGVILNYGTLTVKESSVSGNFTYFGGGIGNDGTLYVTNSTLSDNSAVGGGGIGNTGMLTVTNSTLSNNSASAGGGILNDGGTVYVTNSTLSGNSANGGGISNEGGIVYVTDSIVAQNSPGDCSGAITSLGHNLDSDGSCGLDLSLGDLPNTDPILGPLQDNGGPTPTQALLEGSPAIDAGSENCPPTDQRGVPRPQDGDGDGIARCDMGAFERARALVFLPLIKK